jgi:hypothetical protein
MTLSMSWEPAVLTTGTPVMLPEEGPHAGQGRYGAHGRHRPADNTCRGNGGRPPGPRWRPRRNGSAIRPGGTVLTIARVYRTAERPVETADIAIPVERCSLVYEVPVR